MCLRARRTKTNKKFCFENNNNNKESPLGNRRQDAKISDACVHPMLRFSHTRVWCYLWKTPFYCTGHVRVLYVCWKENRYWKIFSKQLHSIFVRKLLKNILGVTVFIGKKYNLLRKIYQKLVKIVRDVSWSTSVNKTLTLHLINSI